MLPVITYLLCVYLIFKGMEIFQIAYMSNRENRTAGLIVGIGAIGASVFFALVFGIWITSIAADVPSLPRLP